VWSSGWPGHESGLVRRSSLVARLSSLVSRLPSLVMAARIRGRAIPLLWAVYRYEDFYRSQNNIGYGMLHAFRTMVPPSVQVIILADRKF